MTDSTSTEATEPEVSMLAPEVSKAQPSKKEAVAPAPRVKKSSGPSRVVGRGSTDEVSFSRLEDVASGRSRTRKSLTLHHLQARLAELGYPDAAAALDGQYDALTRTAVEQWQKDAGVPVTGSLTREQFSAVFNGDSNVTVVA